MVGRFRIAGQVFSQQFFPGALVGGEAVDGGLHFQAVVAFADPDYTVTGFLAGIENADDVAGAEIGVQALEQSAAEADVAGTGFLQEAVAASVDAPNGEGDVGGAALLAAMVFIGRLFSNISWFRIQAIVGPIVDCAENSHGLLTVPLRRGAVKVGSHMGRTKVAAAVPF